MIRVDLVDPPAYSPPYDHALAGALAHAGASVRLINSRFVYGSVPTPEGYRSEHRFYRYAVGAPGSRLRQVTKLLEHVPDMVAYGRSLSAEMAEVAHFQWLPVPELDLLLLPRRVPTVLTIHDPLQRARTGGGRPGRPRLGAGAFDRVAAVVVHSEYAREAVIQAHGLDRARVNVIRHGALRSLPPAGTLPAELGDRVEPEVPVVLSFGLIRPYKGVDTLLAAWREVSGAELWVVGRPMMDLEHLLANAPAGVRWAPRFVSDAEQAALFERADVVVLPYERSERFGFSGVLATALGMGKAIVLSDIGGFSEVGQLGAAALVEPGNADALARTLSRLVSDPDERSRLGAAALEAARGPFSWETAARATLGLYDRILS